MNDNLRTSWLHDIEFNESRLFCEVYDLTIFLSEDIVLISVFEA